MTTPNNSTGDFFTCIMCGQCCNGYGGTYVTSENIEKIVSFLNISYDEFILQYSIRSDKHTLLAQQENGYCIFWDQEKACLIHPVKPNMCRNWPFIQSVLNDINNWKIMAGLCPGIKIHAKNDQITAYIESYIKKTDTKNQLI